jgi:hypothetical protein
MVSVRRVSDKGIVLALLELAKGDYICGNKREAADHCLEF